MNGMISKTAAVELIERMYKACEGSLSDYHDLLVAAFIDFPPVDAVPVRRGQWRHYEGVLTCSECGTEYYDDIIEWCGDHVPKFCPDCGADMKKDGNDGKTD